MQSSWASLLRNPACPYIHAHTCTCMSSCMYVFHVYYSCTYSRGATGYGCLGTGVHWCTGTGSGSVTQRQQRLLCGGGPVCELFTRRLSLFVGALDSIQAISSHMVLGCFTTPLFIKHTFCVANTIRTFPITNAFIATCKLIALLCPFFLATI